MVLRYRTTPEEMTIISRAVDTIWERSIIDQILRDKLPDHTQDHLPLSDCTCGTIEWELSEPTDGTSYQTLRRLSCEEV